MNRDTAAELERAQELARDQREANAQLVKEAIRAQDAADASRVTEDELRETAEFRERLIGIIGHDLRNPLGAMLMGAGILLARGNLTDEDAYVVGRMIDSGNRMLRLIRDLADFTRARLGGEFPLTRKAVDMRTICRFVADEQSLASSTRVQWTANGDVSGNWDSDRLTEALSNVVGNAIEHAVTGTAVTVEARAEGRDVAVTVSNIGAPIPAELLPHIFEPFRRTLRTPTATRTGNLGLGLFIASQIVRSHGGSIDARSSGGATTFTLRLPRDFAATPPLA